MMFPYYTLQVTSDLPDFECSECLLCDEQEDLVLVRIQELPHYRVCFCSDCLAKIKSQSNELNRSLCAKEVLGLMLAN